MAIFQCHIQVISRGEGRSVVSAAAYRSASRIENNYTGLTDDYTQKDATEKVVSLVSQGVKYVQKCSLIIKYC